ncbi:MULTISPECIES: DUF4843 domain-containing protein [unclassified Butyricimonas]|uniref:DUF4843 domain-containing protein n=1 Tax=unclassified Butyricimonas TaxID=2637652 RepID=UPI000C06E8FE|nr:MULTISPECIES: DUF4843 domain-containing protein [unclassified Butyricimonas]
MKRVYLLVIALFLTLLSCQRDDIMVYRDGNYVQFVKNLVDSSTCSFLAFPNDNQLDFPVLVEVIGLPSQQDRAYKIVVAEEFTTANEDSYIFPTSFIMKAGAVIDTCWITFIKTSEISQQARKLTIRLTETGDFMLGQADCLGNIIYTSNVIAKPDWWNSTVTSSYLGDYSDKKYRLFIQETGKAELDPSDANELRYYTIIFKNYLLKEKDNKTPVLEDDGTEMEVKLIGG